ncbi:MAG: sigma-70 family RNA polymerase sigma factor [Ilumatobacteraceae bacterium]
MTDVVRDSSHAVLAALTAVVRRVVASRVPDRDVVDEIVQETLARLLATRHRLDDDAVGPYAIVTARNLVASRWRRMDTGKRHEHRLFDPRRAVDPETTLIAQEETAAVRAALQRLLPREREVLVAHELSGQDTKSLSNELGATPGAVAAQLHRTRAKLRVEYLLEMNGEPPSASCRPVLLSLSASDTRRQATLDAGHHLLDCEFCATVSEPLLDRRPRDLEETSIPVRVDADIVVARQRGRDVAVQAGFSSTEATVIATAISEIARNIVRFARRGNVTITRVSDGDDSGVMIVARDAGPGIPDIELAMSAGYTTYGGRGLGLPGSRRLMDEFEISSEIRRGTTVTMTKWHRR